jgi:hypothetical protein
MKSCCSDAMETEQKQKKGFKVWLKRIGVAGFLFFLIKGLAWIAVIYGGFRISGCE